MFFSDHQVFSKKKKRFFLESNLFEQFPPRGSFGQINCHNGSAKKNESDILRCWKKKVISFSFSASETGHGEKRKLLNHRTIDS